MSNLNPLNPTFRGYVASTLDALILFEACLNGQLNHVPRRPHDRERQELITSGSIFIYEEHASGIKRWTDGVSWSPSRILNNFLVYRELDRPFPPGEKKRALKKTKKIQGVAKQEATTRSGPSLTSDATAVEKEVERALVGSLVDSYPFKTNGLVKKTISVTFQGVPHHMVSYYNLKDVHSGRLITPTKHPHCQAIVPRGDLLMSQNFRSPIDEIEFDERIVPAPSLYTMSMHPQGFQGVPATNYGTLPYGFAQHVQPQSHPPPHHHHPTQLQLQQQQQQQQLAQHHLAQQQLAQQHHITQHHQTAPHHIAPQQHPQSQAQPPQQQQPQAQHQQIHHQQDRQRQDRQQQDRQQQDQQQQDQQQQNQQQQDQQHHQYSVQANYIPSAAQAGFLTQVSYVPHAQENYSGNIPWSFEALDKTHQFFGDEQHHHNEGASWWPDSTANDANKGKGQMQVPHND